MGGSIGNREAAREKEITGPAIVHLHSKVRAVGMQEVRTLRDARADSAVHFRNPHVREPVRNLARLKSQTRDISSIRRTNRRSIYNSDTDRFTWQYFSSPNGLSFAPDIGANRLS